MKTTEMLEIERALHAIELMLDGRYGDHEFAPWCGPTNLGELSGPAKEAAVRRIEEANNASRERSAIHFCLTSSSMLLNVTQRLMREPAPLSPKDRAQRQRLLVDEIRSAARTAYRAALILIGEEPCLP
ncbi:hypothetical protein [Variovorax sp. RA8]|uniref:hypothetical protein n=1 Tax=Variovorax sp. (strain JCM 16519 / RA8) TaxID=662548 RepID=UPI000AAB962E|nr:hypothetical protein [Variovorax sp. RA8]VTU16437.1 hypothetical protein RA8CHR_01268 [Variovorax sp. RA8]